MSTLKRIDAISVPGVENSLGLFDLPPSVVSYNKTFIKELLPLNTLTRDGPYHFRLYSDSSFTDLSRTYFQVKLSIEKESEGGEWVPINDDSLDDKHTTLIQNAGLSFIKQLKITLNSVEIYNSTVLYPYLAYVKAEYFRTPMANAGVYSAGGYFIDRSEEGHNDPMNHGFQNRVKLFNSGNKTIFLSRLEFDLANQPRLLISNSDIVFSIWPSSDRFLIHAPDYSRQIDVPAVPQQGNIQAIPARTEVQVLTNTSKYRVKVHDVRMYCTLVDVVQSLQNTIARQLESTPAKYPIKRIEMRNHFLPEGLTNLTFNCFQTILPRRVLVFFVDNQAFDGNPEKSPFEFVHNNIQSICIESGGIYVPATPYMLNFSPQNSDFQRAYWDFYKALDMDEDGELGLTMADYGNGWCGFGFDLRSFNRELGDSFELIKNSNTLLKFQLSTPIQEGGMQLLVWGEFDSVITINNDRVIAFDGSI